MEVIIIGVPYAIIMFIMLGFLMEIRGLGAVETALMTTFWPITLVGAFFIWLTFSLIGLGGKINRWLK